MSKKSKKFQGHKRDGKPVKPVITYMPPSQHARVKAACKRLGITQTAFLNAAIARKLSDPDIRARHREQAARDGAAESIAA